MTYVKTLLCGKVDLRYDWMTPWGLAIEERRLKASHPVITPSWPTSCWPDAPGKAPSRNGNQP